MFGLLMPEADALLRYGKALGIALNAGELEALGKCGHARRA